MKKFLSLVLTLALTLSLVVVPARATETETGGTISGTTTLGVGGTSELTVAPKESYTDGDATYTLKAESISYVWSSTEEAKATVSGNTDKATVTAVAVGGTTVKCSVTATYVKTGEPADEQEKTYVASKTVTVKSLTECLDKITLNGRTYAANAEIKKLDTETLTKTNFTAVTLKSGSPYATPKWDYASASNKLTVSAKADGAATETAAQTAEVTVTSASAGTVTIAGKGTTIHTTGSGTDYIRVGEAGVLKASFTKQLGTYTGNVTYKWYKNESTTAIANANSDELEVHDLSAGEYTFVVEAYEGTTKVATSETYGLTVNADTYSFAAATYDSKMTTGFTQTLKLTPKDNGSAVTVPAEDISISWSVKSGDGNKVSLPSTKTTTNAGIVVTAGSTSGTATVYATPTYQNKTYPQVEFTITIAALDKTLSDIDNGDCDYYSLNTLKGYAASVINGVYSSKNLDDDDIQHIYVSSLPSASKLVLYNDSDCESGDKFAAGNEITDELYVEAVAGFLGTESFKLKVKTNESSNNEYIITFFVESTAYETVNATASAEEGSSSTVSFTLPDDYDYWYIYESSSFKTELYENYTGSGWSNKLEEGKTYSRLKVSDFDDGDVTLYVVGLNKNGVASTGKLVVALDAYDIEYSGVAGETITFDQDDFDDLLKEVAEDRDQDGNKAKVEFTNVTFTLPTEKTAGILYNNGEQIKSNSKTAVKECTDLDKVTFAIADKAKSEVIIKFKMTYDYYKDSSKSSKTAQTVNGRVAVSVVNEDIKYSVPVGGNVVFDASDFEDFFTDEYKNGTLSYVTFNKYTGTNGILYATYSTIGYGKTAKDNDKFYYDSSKAADLDLDDVTFVSSTFAKAGEKIYLPFTAYGTKSSQKVEGCVAITLTAARTMNFIDVTTADWFYNNVKNAFTMGLIEGKTTTTFNPNDNMTWAEAVTLAARMNELYYTGKVTLSNSTSGNWYSNYESYAISKGIISTYLGAKANTNISRRDYVDIFYNALPYSAYTARNSVTKIPDLANDSTNAKIYTFYRAGILTGYANTAGKANGSFGPNDNIKRSEVATILIRMMDSSTRMYFTL